MTLGNDESDSGTSRWLTAYVALVTVRGYVLLYMAHLQLRAHDPGTRLTDSCGRRASSSRWPSWSGLHPVRSPRAGPPPRWASRWISPASSSSGPALASWIGVFSFLGVLRRSPWACGRCSTTGRSCSPFAAGPARLPVTRGAIHRPVARGTIGSRLYEHIWPARCWEAASLTS